MSFTKSFEKVFHFLLPAPFTIAVILTLVTMFLALGFGEISPEPSRTLNLLAQWQTGLWNPPLMVFALQMMIILVLGHALALSPAVGSFIDRITGLSQNPQIAAFLVCFFTLIVAFFNWGLGLIFGAIIARKTGERFAQMGIPINYPLLGAAGYSGLMVWHGGISGSAPIKVAESDHLTQLMNGFWTTDQLAELPQSIPLEATVFSTMNITTSVILLIVLPSIMALFAKSSSLSAPRVITKTIRVNIAKPDLVGAERLDHSRLLNFLFATIILGYGVAVAWNSGAGLGFITINYVNLILLGLCLFFHGSFSNFVSAIDQAIGGAAGILIQFPLYFGIMGIMSSSGLIASISDWFIGIANPTSFPIFTFLSAGIVNVFVPSGGGQWAIQGPIIIEAALKLNVSLPKCIMALAYGDQLTNMLQPFWALPLLGITGLKAREILPYTLILLVAGAIIFISSLLLF